ncbi:MotA/TolQ/ExbB proton channel family protein [Pinirhizobacter sp.]|jgi:biopolymer transport protein TolQ|uniref:MotA/TolQ/ExbB proton channel family protein n=1 Tax=Pinirhizobacter sp. TaxID=2950432 RepID=UPI002F416145
MARAIAEALIMPGVLSKHTAYALATSLDIPELFDRSHWIVKCVMILLALMFVVGLYIIIYKALYIRRAAAESAKFTDSFWRSRDIEQIYKQAQALRNSPISQMFVAGYTELAKLASDDALKDDREGNLANIERALRRAQTVETTKLESMTPFLATTGSAGPFIGLFGTVMGILFAFQDMKDPGNGGAASLQKIGPHIAEALFATAIGLIAAIPAVMAYNFFTRRIRVLRSEMDMFEQDYLNIIKRHFLR